MKVKFIGRHKFYHPKVKGQIETPEEKAKRLYAIIPEGTVCEVTRKNGNMLDFVYDDPTDGKKKYLMACLHCHGDKMQLIEDGVENE